MDARKTRPSDSASQTNLSSDSTLARAFSTFLNENGYRDGNKNKDNWNDYGNRRGGRGFRGRGRGRGGRGRGRGSGQFGSRNQKKSEYDQDKFCRYCQLVGHDIHVCRKYARSKEERKKGNNDGKDGNSGGSGGSGRSEQYQPNLNVRSYTKSANLTNYTANVIRFIANSSQISPPSNSWLVDSCANAYITPYKSDLRFFVEDNIGQVKGFGGKLETALGKGPVTLSDSAGNRITLNDVYYVPGSQDRIISLMKFRREHNTDFQFTGMETFTMTAANGFQLSGTSINDILHVSFSISQANVAITRSAARRSLIEVSSEPSDTSSELDSTSESEDLEPIQKRPRQVRSPSPELKCSPSNLWHLRYGHASSSTLRKLKLIKSTFESKTCVPCIRAKKTHRHFSASESKVTDKLGRIHSDICGQYPESQGNSIYNLTFLDEVTHWAYSIPIPDKSSETVKEHFKNYIAAVERETGLKIKKLRTDGGGEYQGALKPILSALGIKHEKTPPRTPEINGKAERLNRTLNDTVRTMLIQANLPQSFWAEAMVTATYLRNRLPSNSINDRIPYEEWFNKSLDAKELKKLKPFGCIVWDHIDKKVRGKRSKMQDRATPGCFIGYDTTGYKYWNFTRKTFMTSPNLTFMETEFPDPSDFAEAQAPTPSGIPSAAQPVFPISNIDTESESEPESRTIHDEIVVEPVPSISALATSFGPTADTTPLTFAEATAGPDRDEWLKAMVAEIQAIIHNKTWDLVDLPMGKKAIPLKWVYKIKHDAKGNFEKYKARIVVKGFSQIAGLDFDETFAPVVRIESIRILFSIAAVNDLYILHVDCKNAFLHGESDVALFVLQPEGFPDTRFPNKVLRLNKSLYGLKQAPRIWYLFLCGVIVGIGFVALETDPCIYVRRDIILEVYVDDIKIVGPTKEHCDAVFKELAKHVNIESKGPIQSFLGINIIRNWNQHLIALNQGAYIDRLIEEFGFTNATTAATPLEHSLQLVLSEPGDRMCNKEYYQRLTGSLNHLAVFTRPDISFAASKLAQFNSNPNATHLSAAQHVLRYLKGTRNLSIVFKRQQRKDMIVGYSDSDWGSDSIDRKSFTGYVYMVNGGPATWKAHKQSTVAHSSTDAEYMAMADASREAIARIQFLQELGISAAPIPILADSQTALEIANGTAVNHSNAKHIDIKFHAIRHYIHDDKVTVNHIPGSENPADLFTKALTPPKHQQFVELLGMRNSFEIIE